MRWTYQDLERVFEAVQAVEPSDPKRARKRARILSAATALFIRHGYRRASLDEVAREAGVAKGTLYLYFASKADLLIAAITEEKKEILERFRSVLDADVSGPERLRLWLRGVLEGLSEMPLSLRLLEGDREFSAVLDDMDPDLVQQTLDLKVSFLAPLVAEARGRTEPEEGDRTTARVLIATFQSGGFFHDDRLRLGMDLRSFQDHLVDLLLAGVVAPAAVPASETAG